MKCPELETGRREVSQHVCVLSVAGELRSPILGLLEETFLDFNLLQASCVGSVLVYVRRKAFAVFCILVTCGAESVFVVFLPHV